MNIDSLEELFKYKVDFLITDSKTAYYISNNKIIKAKNNHLINSSSNGCGDAFLAGFLACDGSVIEKLNSGMDKALERALFNSKGE